MLLSDYSSRLGYSKSIVTCYNNCGILVFSNGALKLLIDCVKKGEDAAFSREIALELCPPLPVNTNVTAISVCSGGSKVAILAPSGCWIVQMNSQLWSQSTTHVQHWAQLLQPTYISQVTQVQPALWSGRPKSMNVVKWIPVSASLTAQHFIALLTDDSVIRIFNADSDLTTPLLRVDFGSLITHGMNASFQKTNTFGLINRLVSFCISVSASLHPSLVAIDTEGDLYHCEIDLLGEEVFEPKALVSPQCVPYDPVDMVVIPHPLSHLFTVVSVLATDNTVTHLLLVPDETGLFSVFAHDQQSIPCKSADSQLQAVVHSEARGEYVLATEDTLYFVSCMTWIIAYRNLLEQSSASQAVSAIPVSSITELLSVSMSTDNKENVHSSIVSLPSVTCLTARDSSLSSPHVYLISTEDGGINATFVRHVMTPTVSTVRCTSASAPSTSVEGSESSWASFKQNLDNVISSKAPPPKFVGSASTSENEILDKFLQYADVVLANVQKDRKACQMTLDRIVGLHGSRSDVKIKKADLELHISRVLSELRGAKDAALEARERMQNIEKRMDNIVSRACSGVPLTEEEEKMSKALRHHRKDIELMNVELPKLNLAVQEEKCSLIGPVKSFATTPYHRQRNADRCIREVELLERRMKDIQERTKQLGIDDEHSNV